MCGICAIVSFRGTERTSFHGNFLESFKNRGPNHYRNVVHSFKLSEDIKVENGFGDDDGEDEVELQLLSSVLHLRGSSLYPQPVMDDVGNALLWNGEIFDGNCLQENPSKSDTEMLSERLFSCKEDKEVVDIIQSIRGPFAFIFYQASGLLWFGRDIFGRRSLLWNVDESALHISSTSNGNKNWFEVPALGIFRVNLNYSIVSKHFLCHLIAWSHGPSGTSLPNMDFSIFYRLTCITLNTIELNSPISESLNPNLPSSETLSSVPASENFSPQEILLQISTLPAYSEKVLELERVLSESVRRRVLNQQGLCKDCYQRSSETCGHAAVGVLFSGGLDSIVIACLADRHLPKDVPIDLLNVAFASNRNLKHNQNATSTFDTPDRTTGRDGVLQLQEVCPGRRWNFVEINVPEETLVEKRKEVICKLLEPSCTVLDDSIGCALWFASHGKGILQANSEIIQYKSPVRVLLVGMGADEQLAGYSRHRAVFSSRGWDGLLAELSLELNRIGSRNLGRDDRVIADNGVESRYPFLDENVVSFLNATPVWLKANLNYPRGVGEKLLLRMLAWKLGLANAAVLPKRAIQFGSRIAKIENSKEKGSDVCDRLRKMEL